ncbi:hypothetical protein RI367_003365 [Sorochytrium milnesiophthora]
MSMAQTTRVAIVPHSENMFSDMRNYPPYHVEVRITPANPTIGQNRYVAPEPAFASGKHRAKYFRRPMIPYSATSHGASQVVFMKRPATQAAVEPLRPPSPPTKTVGIQTLYRESEAQTDPYSPAYTLPPGSTNPEILALASLTHKAGLPAGLAEVEMIERARAKKQWEASLPKVIDEHTFNQRLRMMEEMELKEWAAREQEIQRLQEARLEILTKLLTKRESENEAVQNERIQRMWQRKLQDKDVLHSKIEAKRAKELKKLSEKRKNIEGKLIRRDVIADYADYTSTVYAPKTRDGKHPDANLSALAAEPPDLLTYQGLSTLEALFPVSVVEADLSQPQQQELKSPAARKEAQVIAQLEMMNQKLRDSKRAAAPVMASLGAASGDTKALAGEERQLPKFQVRVEKPKPRPATPTLEATSPEEEAKHQAALLIQKVIRGRIGQIVMFQGKERRQDLIDELRIGLSIANAAKDTPLETCLTQERIPTPAQLMASDTSLEPTEQALDIALQGRFVGERLDFLSKEIQRLREEQKIAAVVKLANRMRRMREAAESGQRQKELKKQEEEDALFKQVMKVHQQTVDSYLEDVFASSVESAASMVATNKVREMAQMVDTAVMAADQDDAAAHGSAADPDSALIRNLVTGFLVPEVEKRSWRQQVQNTQQKYLLVAHQSIYGAVEEAEKVTRRQEDEEVPLAEDVLRSLTINPDELGNESAASDDEDIIQI